MATVTYNNVMRRVLKDVAMQQQQQQQGKGQVGVMWRVLHGPKAVQ